MRKSKYFTLVELLIVVSIILLLAGMLLPALRSARESSKRTFCVSSMRQTGVALLSYAGDNNSFMPTYYNPTGTAGVNRYWEDLLASYCNAKYISSTPMYKGSIFQGCPSFNYTGLGDTGPYTYEILYWCVSSTVNDIRGILRPSRAGILVDGGRNEGSYVNAKIGLDDEDWTLARFLRNRHKSGVNILFCDGHIEWKKAKFADNLGSIFRYDAQ